MRVRFVTSLALIALVVGVALAWRTTSMGLQSREPSNIKVVINQLPAKEGVIPIEMIQPAIVSSAPNKLDDLTYILRNNSGKAVIALALIKTISYEEGGKVYAQSRYSTMDAAFHSDMGGRPFLPESQMSMESAGPLSFNESVVIKEIALTVEYVSYADQTAYGSGGEGERRINGMREGARRYKGWLVQEYSRAGKSLTTIFPVIETHHIPGELKLDSDQTMGADRYRLQLLTTLRTKGAADVEGYLNRPNR
jgi:hypothetical protein